MNKSERDALAGFLAEMKYGMHASTENANRVDRMLEKFPSVRSQYQFAAECEAADTLIHQILKIISSYGDVSIPFQSLADNKFEIGFAFSEWCEKNGTSAVRQFDESVPLKELALNANLKSYMKECAKDNPLLSDFFKFWKNFRVNFNCLYKHVIIHSIVNHSNSK